MKLHTLPVKRRPVTKGIMRRLSAVTGNRKQRAAAATAEELESDNFGSKISRILTVIFLIHIVAIGVLFIHVRFLEGRPGASAAGVKAAENKSAGSAASSNTARAALVGNSTSVAGTQRRGDLPRLSAGEKPYIVRAGDNYTRIAASEEVDEGDLRLLNQHVDIGPGLILKIPPKRIVAEEPPEVAAIRAQTPSDGDRGLVEAVDVSHAPKAKLVRPNTSRADAAQAIAAPQTASGKSYVVQPGDSIFRISSRFHVNQAALMRANNISDPRKMKTGMKLTIPQR